MSLPSIRVHDNIKSQLPWPVQRLAAETVRGAGWYISVRLWWALGRVAGLPAPLTGPSVAIWSRISWILSPMVAARHNEGNPSRGCVGPPPGGCWKQGRQPGSSEGEWYTKNRKLQAWGSTCSKTRGLRGSEPSMGRGLAANCTAHRPQHIIDIPEGRGRELISCWLPPPTPIPPLPTQSPAKSKWGSVSCGKTNDHN